MQGKSDRGRGAAEPAGWPGWAAEVIAVTLVFAAAGAWPAPDSNEAVYLTKARHAADPAWAAGDFFLETPDAHGLFYAAFGPIAATRPLAEAAWIGRWLGWACLAAGFLHGVAPAVATRLGRLAAAAMFSLLVRHTAMAGEWVIGGCEAKVFAWALVFAGVGEWLRGRLGSAVVLAGLATAWHPVVGGWAGLAIVAAWIARGDRRLGRFDLPLIAAGVAAAAVGVVPALLLSAGADPEVRAAAARIYVVERLSHHLLLRSFGEAFVARHFLAAVVWWLVRGWLPATPAGTRLTAFTLASLGISAAGLAISLAEPVAPGAVVGLLRFYWFRLGDVAVPLALATTTAAVLEDSAACGRAFGGRPAVVRGVVAALLAADLAVQSLHWPLPGRTGPAPRADAKVDAVAWRDVCEWVRANTPAGARFLTPRGAASFTWWTDRPEVVSWKNSPQDAVSLVEWRRRILDCFSRDGRLADLDRTTAALGPERLVTVAERYGATHAIVPLDAPLVADIPSARLYANGVYAVYRIPERRAP